ncbi:MAG: cation transporter, partial [Verrucomicrobia bacterium]|nr:cation transporter [Verrucomicrobiota bacterium]
LLAFGVSGVAVSATFEKYRPLFATLTFGFLAAAFYFAYRPKLKTAAATSAEGSACCTTATAKGDCCPPEGNSRWTLQRFNRAMLWVVTAIALAFVFFPNYIGALLGGGKDAGFGANVEQYVVAVEGMDCAGCAAGLEKRLKAVPGVSAAMVSYEKKEAIIGVPKGAAAPRDEVLTAITAAGLKGRFENMETRTLPIAGMTCEACATHVQASLAKVPGVRSAAVSYKERKAVVVAAPSVDPTALNQAVESAGYKVAAEATPASDK